LLFNKLMPLKKKRVRQNIWLNEWNDLIRGASGGFLLGTPLLYTMEVWWIGSLAEPPRMLISLLTNFVVVFLLIRTEGFRRTGKIGLIDAMMDSIETLAIGAICAAIILVLIREINLATSINEALGKIVFESAPFSLGVAVANSALSGDRDGRERTSRNHEPNGQKHLSPNSTTAQINATLADIGATLIGAIFMYLLL